MLSSEFIRQLRGRRTQAAFSKRLGARTNVVHTWEAGRRWPTATLSLKAAATAGIDVRAALTRFYRTSPGWLSRSEPTQPAFIADLLEDLRGNTKLADVAARTGRSRFAVARWLKGEAEPRLPDFFRMIEGTSLRLLDFVAAFVDPNRLPSIADSWQELEAGRRAAYELPWSHAVLRVLELARYQSLEKHEPGFIAKQLGITTNEEQACLEALIQAGQLVWDGRRYHVLHARLTDTRQNPEADKRLKLWWYSQALEHLEQDKEGLFSYNLFTVSERDYQRLKELHLAYFRELRSIVAASELAERVVLANVQLLPLAGA